ncbi:hypothetical protein F5Y01DRAFT_161071 [Xylaria sp. FL0043]|nr:hypothetical protein F5Y01DRAFT_161071 [Xylaria sp. FL0043]
MRYSINLSLRVFRESQAKSFEAANFTHNSARSFIMCHAHPQYHPCSHTSVRWMYCPEAKFEVSTGYESPCAKPIWLNAQPVKFDCPLKNCNFKALRGSWSCCVCGQGPNTQGWCTVPREAVDWNPLTQRMETMDVPCGHGCCGKCSRYR